MEEEVPWASGRYDTVTLSFQLLTNSCPHLPWVYQRLQRVESVFNTVCLLSAYRVSRITLDLEAQCWAGQVWISPLGATSSAGPGTHTDGHRARGGGACQSPVVLSTRQPEAPGLNPRVVFLRGGSLSRSSKGGRLAEAGRKCLPGLVALEVLRDEGCPFPEEGTMAVWSLNPEPSLGGGRLGGEGQVSARPLHTHTGLKARGAVWSGPWPPLSDHGLRHGMTQEWGGGARPKGPPAASSACCLAP